MKLLERLIQVFTDPGDVVIDPVAGSGSTLLAAMNTGRRAYGFEIKKDFHRTATEMLTERMIELNEIRELGFSPTKLGKVHPTLFDAMRQTA